VGVALRLIVSLLPRPLKIGIYRLMGMKIGRDVRIGLGTLLLCKEVELMEGARIGNFCIIRARSLKMGKRAQIYNFVKIAVFSLVMKSQSAIFSFNDIAGDTNDKRSVFYLGPCSWLFSYCFVNVTREIVLRRNVGVGGGSYLFTHGLWLSKLDGFPISFGPITVEDDVWLPWGCFLMPNVIVSKKAIIGARSVVNRSIPEGVLAAGVPAKVIREKSYSDLSSDDKANILAELTEDYGRHEELPVRVDRSAEVDLHYVGTTLVLALHKLDVPKYLPPPTLNVVFSELDLNAASKFCIWSLHDYASTPYPELSKQVRNWLAYARTIGVRFYPIDEDTS
jgi:acetyltransferase-like isoleucine patch superfamily enzyme